MSAVITRGKHKSSRARAPKDLGAIDPLLVTYCFLLLFGPKIGRVDWLSVTCVVVIGHAVLLRAARFQRRLAVPFIILYALAMYSVVVALWTNGELLWVARAFRGMLNLAGAYALCLLHSKRYGRSFAPKLLYHTFWAIAVHGMIMVAEFVSPAFRSQVYSRIGFYDAQGFRVPGITISFGITALTQGFGLLLAGILAPRIRSIRHQLLFTVATAVVVASLFLAGRVGLFLMGLFFMVVLIYMARIAIRTARLGMIMPLAALVLWAGFALLPGNALTAFLDSTLPHILEPFRAYEQTGRFEGRTITAVRGMYFLPDDAETLIFGAGVSGRGDVYVASDVGFVLSIYGIGLIGTSIMLMLYIYALLTALSLRRYDKTVALVAMLFWLAVILLNFKEQALLTRHGFSVTAILIGISLLSVDTARTGKHVPKAAI